jgi:hypothetical protein
VSAASLHGDWSLDPGEEEVMLDWIQENPTTMSEASGHGVKEWKFFLDRRADHVHVPGVDFIGYTPALRYRYVQPQTSFSSFFSSFLDDESALLAGIDGPSTDVVLSEFVPPSERDLFEHLAGFGALGSDASHIPEGDLARLFDELEALEGWGEVFSGWMSTDLLAQVTVPSKTSPGIRWKKLGYKTKKEALMPATLEAAQKLKRMMDTGEEYSTPPAGVAGRGKRVDANRDKSKPDRKEGRLIVMPDLVRHLLGSMTSGPYMHKLRGLDKSGGGVVLGMGPFSDSYENIARWAKGASSFAFIDFKKFDQRIPRRLLRAVMKYISRRFEKIPGSKAYWKSEARHLIETEIAMPSGHTYKKRRGVASGDPWTSLADSYANWIILKRVFDLMGLTVKIWTFGDDSVVAIYGPAPPDLLGRITALARSEFGMEVSQEKSYVSENLVDIEDDPVPKGSGSFLSMYFLQTEFGVRPTRPLQDLYELFLVPEKNRESVEWEVARTSAAYLTFYYNSKARYVLHEYWDWLHRTQKIPELTGSYVDLQLLRELDIPWAAFKIEWMTRLPRPGEVELMYKYGHTGFYPPVLWGAWYSKYDREKFGNSLSWGTDAPPWAGKGERSA